MFLSVFSGLSYFHYAYPGNMVDASWGVSFVLILIYLAFFTWIVSEK